MVTDQSAPVLRHFHSEPAPEVLSVSRWLAHQRAVTRELMDPAAYQLMAGTPPIASGPSAAVVAQPRGVVWAVGRLGGEPLLHVVSDAEAAHARALALGAELGVEAIVIDQAGELVRQPPFIEAPVLRVVRHEDRWAVMLEGRIVATAPTRERARIKQRALRADPDFMSARASASDAAA